MAALQIAINCHLHVSDTSEQARNEFFPPYSQLMNRVGRERGWSPMDRQHFEYLCGPQGPLFVGSPADIVAKLQYQHSLFGNTRFLAQLVIEGIPHQHVLHSIELLGTQVAPAVRAAVGAVPAKIW